MRIANLQSCLVATTAMIDDELANEKTYHFLIEKTGTNHLWALLGTLGPPR